GPEKRRLEKMARANIEFVGLVSEEKLRHFYAHCRAFIFPQEEDFGIAPVEAMASGRPVIAFRAGGALEFIKEGETGIFFNDQTKTSLMEALRCFDNLVFDAAAIQAHARQFDQEVFKKKIRDFVNQDLISQSNR
ncbi:MAG: glycosyltransferase, partial [Patescibacteria group bacterium]